MNKARIAGIFYWLTFATGIFALLVRSRLGVAAGLAAGVCYIAVTFLFYGLFKPVDRRLSLLAACVSFVGIAVGPLQVKAVRSTFLPRILGVLMACGGLGWLTFLSPPLANQLSPYNFAPGIIGEGALTVWLLVFGVDVPRWEFMKTADARMRA